jgi:type II secretory pathway pseudopilin PulG
MRFNMTKKQAGFNIVEVAFGLIIFGLIIGGLMGPLQVQLDNMDRRETLQVIETTKEAIIGFALRNGRLPCPDTSTTTPRNGQENIIAGNCSSARGSVPWVTLGVNSVDAWQQPLTYRVDRDFADNTDGTGCPDSNAAGISFEMCSLGDITVRSTSTGALVASNVPAIIVSHGENGIAGGDVNEQENSDNDANFVDKNHINQGYDDLVGWVNINNLIGKMVSANKLP